MPDQAVNQTSGKTVESFQDSFMAAKTESEKVGIYNAFREAHPDKDINALYQKQDAETFATDAAQSKEPGNGQATKGEPITEQVVDPSKLFAGGDNRFEEVNKLLQSGKVTEALSTFKEKHYDQLEKEFTTKSQTLSALQKEYDSWKDKHQKLVTSLSGDQVEALSADDIVGNVPLSMMDDVQKKLSDLYIAARKENNAEREIAIMRKMTDLASLSARKEILVKQNEVANATYRQNNDAKKFNETYGLDIGQEDLDAFYTKLENGHETQIDDNTVFKTVIDLYGRDRMMTYWKTMAANARQQEVIMKSEEATQGNPSTPTTKASIEELRIAARNASNDTEKIKILDIATRITGSQEAAMKLLS